MLKASEASITSSGAREIGWLELRVKARGEGAVSRTGRTSTLVENCSLNQASQVARNDCSNHGAAMTQARLAATMPPTAQAPNRHRVPWGVRRRL